MAGSSPPTFPFRVLASRITVTALALLASLTLLQGVGCTTAPAGTPIVDEAAAASAARPRGMRVVSAFGGSHRTLEIVGGTWFQCFANRLLLLDAQSGALVSDIELSPRGTTGPAVDLAVVDGRAFVVLERDALIELDVASPRHPAFVARWGRPELGIAPLTVSVVDGEIYVSGDGGAVRLADAEPEAVRLDDRGRPIPPVPPVPLLAGMQVGTIVAADGGPVACVGRRILRLADGSFLGAASMLVPLSAELGGGYAFMLQAPEVAQVGLMGPDFRERSSSAVEGTARALRVLNDRLFVVTATQVDTWKISRDAGAATTVRGEGTQLGELLTVRVRGAFDVGRVKLNRFAVAGSFGRALYRYLPEGDQPGETFYWTERMPGRLDIAVSDRRRILASSDEGAWLYLIEDTAELVEREITEPDAQSPRAEVAWGAASSEEPREEISIRVGDRQSTVLPSRGGKVSTIIAADGRLWIGHDHGIDVYGYDSATAELVAEDRIVLEGPIVALYPSRVGGGVSFVARFGGFGVIRAVPLEDEPILHRGSVRGYAMPSTGAEGGRAREVR